MTVLVLDARALEIPPPRKKAFLPLNRGWGFSWKWDGNGATETVFAILPEWFASERGQQHPHLYSTAKKSFNFRSSTGNMTRTTTPLRSKHSTSRSQREHLARGKKKHFPKLKIRNANKKNLKCVITGSHQTLLASVWAARRSAAAAARAWSISWPTLQGRG